MIVSGIPMRIAHPRWSGIVSVRKSGERAAARAGTAAPAPAGPR